MCCGPGLTPNFNGYLDLFWGAGTGFWTAFGGGVSLTFIYGTNPPYYLDQFAAMYPKFFGAPTVLACVTANGSAVVTPSSTANMAPGQFIQSPNLPPNSVISSVNGDGTITVNQQATADGSANLTVYLAPPIPLVVIQMYVNLAEASIVQKQYRDSWLVAMGLYIAHYCTLYSQSDGIQVQSIVTQALGGQIPVGAKPGTVFTLPNPPVNGVLQMLFKNGLQQDNGVDYTFLSPNITMTQSVNATDSLYAIAVTQSVQTSTVYPSVTEIAAQGLATGTIVSKSVGDVSAGYQGLESLKDYGSWNLTRYGQQLATLAQVTGMGPGLYW